MAAVLEKAGSFFVIIFFAYALKKLGFFQAKDYRLIAKIVLNITLPAAVISSFAGLGQMTENLYYLVFLGFLCNIAMLVLAYFFSRKKNRPERAFFLFSVPGYNIGCFTLPFMQSFLGHLGVVATCFFDMGNSIMCTSGTFALVSNMLGQHEKPSLRKVLKTLFSSVPFLIYLLLLFMTMAGLHFPQPFLTLASIIGAANPFLSMFMIGLMFEIKGQVACLKEIGWSLLLRYVGAALFSVLFYFCLPLPQEIRQILAIVVFAPITSLAGVFTEGCQGDGAMTSFASSLSILISIAIMTGLTLYLHIGF